MESYSHVIKNLKHQLVSTKLQREKAKTAKLQEELGQMQAERRQENERREQALTLHRRNVFQRAVAAQEQEMAENQANADISVYEHPTPEEDPIQTYITLTRARAGRTHFASVHRNFLTIPLKKLRTDAPRDLRNEFFHHPKEITEMYCLGLVSYVGEEGTGLGVVLDYVTQTFEQVLKKYGKFI